MTRQIHPQFRDEQSASRYPFADHATLVSSSGVQIDPRLFIDAILHPVDNALALHIAEVTLSGLQVTLVIANEDGAVCTGTIELSELDGDGLVPLVDALDRPAGVLVSDPDLLASVLSWPQGTTVFGAAAAQFAATCVTAAPEIGVRGLRAADAVPLVGDVWLVGDDGISLRVDDDGLVRVDVVGEPLAKRRLCNDSPLFNPPKFVKTINSIPPTEWGGFRLQVGRVLNRRPALRIYQDGEAIVIGLASK